MRSFPLPFNEAARAHALEYAKVLDSRAEPVFDRSVALVRKLIETPTALVSLVDRDRQWFKARDGFDLTETPRSLSLCSYTIMSEAPLIIPDAHDDPRFASHPVVVNPPHVRFYVGAPIILSNGFRVGSLCAIDYVAREPPPPEAVAALQDLAAIVAAAIEMRPEGADGTAGPGSEASAAADLARMEFLSLISHELRTPLNGVLGLASLLELQVEDDTTRELVEGILASGRNLTRVVESILHFSDVARGELQLNEVQSDLHALLERSFELTRPAATLAGKSLRLETPGAETVLLLDTVQFEVALACLIGNAVVHGGEHVEVACRSEVNGETVISVRDDGAGIAAERAAHVFAPFAVGEEVTRRRAGGIGMGLPLSRRLVELHGGELTSDCADGWTVFEIRLPAFRTCPA